MNDLPLDRLGPYPILQLVGGLLVLAGLALAIYKGSRDKQSTQSQVNMTGEQRYYFDGPIGEALKLLRDLRNISNEIKEHVQPLGEQGRVQNKTLDEIKDAVVDLKDSKGRHR